MEGLVVAYSNHEVFCGVCLEKHSLAKVFDMEAVPSIAQFFSNNKDVAIRQTTQLRLLYCNECGHLQLENPPVPYYRQSIRSSSVSLEMRKFRRNQFKDFFIKHSIGSHEVCEIGCGPGDYCGILSEFTSRLVGFEHKPNEVNGSKMGYSIVDHYPGEPVPKGHLNRYSAFFCFNFLEHSPEPRKFLKSVTELLVPGAVGIVEVPNTEMIQANNMVNEICIEHLQYFNQKTFKLLLTLCGFEILSIKSILNDYVLSAEVRLRTPTVSLNAKVFINELQNSFHDLLKDRNVEVISLWGAGHQAMTTISLLGCHDKFANIYDSAPHKIDRYAPGTALRIKEPSAIVEDVVHSLLILAGSYSEEIRRIVMDRFPRVKNIALLEGSRFYWS